MFVIDDIILAEAAAALAPEMVAALGAGEAAAGAGALEATMGAEALGVPAGFEAGLPAGLEAAGLAAAEQGAIMYPGIPPAASMGPQAGLQLAQVGSAPTADAIATGVAPEAAADKVAGVTRSFSPSPSQADIVDSMDEAAVRYSSAANPSSGTFDKALEWAKKDPGMAISGGMLGLSAVDRMLGNRGGMRPAAPYSGPLSKYRLSPEFKGLYANPRDFEYTPMRYNYAGGGAVNYAKGGEAASAMMDMYERMMRRSPTLHASDSPDAPRSVGIVQDADPDTRNLDALRATQVRMAKLRKRAVLAPDKMPPYTSLGAMNVGLGKADGAATEMAGGGTVGGNQTFPLSHIPNAQLRPNIQDPQQANVLRNTPAPEVDPFTGEAKYAYGGILGGSTLGGYAAGGNPRLLKGPGDGMSDDIPATINHKQPARLADGEFVVPADVVSHLGNGSTDAGAKKLHDMMTKVREARTGNPKQGKQIKADKYLPK